MAPRERGRTGLFVRGDAAVPTDASARDDSLRLTVVRVEPCDVPSHIVAPLHARSVSFMPEESPQEVCEGMTLPIPAALRSAAPRRVAGFLAGRYCAVEALRAAGCTDASPAVDRHANGAPLWPRGFIGSISHTDDRALAVVAAAGKLRGVGVDCERVVSPKEADGIARAVIPEIDAAEVVAGGSPLTWEELVTVGFSAKESLYKCLRPLVGVFFDFADAHVVHVDLPQRRLVLRLTRALAHGYGAGWEIPVSFSARHGLAVTLVTLPSTKALGAREPNVRDDFAAQEVA